MDNAAPPQPQRRKRVAVLGSTGSVGTSTLSLLENRGDRFEVVALAANGNAQALEAQCRRFAPAAACLVQGGSRPSGLRAETAWLTGSDGVLEALEASRPDLVLNAITGAAGLPASEWTLRAGKPLALANKESLVMAGPYLVDLAKEHGAPILPVDSEHCAIHQCLAGVRREAVRKIYLTGSGGPFRMRPLDTFTAIRPDEALVHPTWTMGPRITVGSATMMNKAFEIVEARWLFDFEPEQIDVVLHPQSIVHSMVELVDGSMLAQLGLPDMRVPILYCLAWPERLPFEFRPFDFARWRNLEFLPPQAERYPALALGYDVLKRGGDSGACLNAADEVLTAMFLAGEAAFPAITDTVALVLRSRPARPIRRLSDVVAADAEARQLARECAHSGQVNTRKGPMK